MAIPAGYSQGISGFYFKTDGAGPYWLDPAGVIRTFAGDLVEAITTGWSYAPPVNGITNTSTAVTIKTAAGSGIRNYLTGVQLSSDPLGSGTEFVIRDGAGGAVLWRSKLTTAGFAPSNLVLARPIISSPNTLLEIVTLTPTLTGGVFFNGQGYTA